MSAESDPGGSVPVLGRRVEELPVQVLPPVYVDDRVDAPSHLEAHVGRARRCLGSLRDRRRAPHPVRELAFPEVRDRLRVQAEGGSDVPGRHALHVVGAGALGEEDESVAGWVGPVRGEQGDEPACVWRRLLLSV